MAIFRFFIAAFLLLFTSCADQLAGADCIQVQTGSFMLKQNGDIPAFLVTRTQSRQFETNQETGEKRIFRVKWLTDCEYELSLLKKIRTEKKTTQSAFRDSIEVIPSVVRVIKVTGHYYIFEISKENFPPMRDTLWKTGGRPIDDSKL